MASAARCRCPRQCTVTSEFPHDPAAAPGPPPTQQFAYGPPPAPPKRRLGTGAIIGIVVGALVLACCGITGIAALFGANSQQQANPKSSAAAIASPVSPSAAPPAPTPPPTTTAPEVTTAATTTPAAPTKLVMPNLKGTNAAIADDKLRKLGFTNIRFGSQDERDTVVLLLTNWTVTKQSTKAGAKLLPDDLIVLTCTKGG
ncbi:PASTA domain-containing protein [Verrucosispora sp. WMMD1129]|uniref:PASTA domain-containing protein n=1 Tax=Verrucosispora sp. WMMD1129 TaxID=3016093 RepID=UPI00249C18A4|nr:PASTA domain-containing protein [Verrucosispora sp. WMMD1129]WFE47570.1 PASTA domain-containing protein [Verrucosispora sp. WMMD1129]